MTQYYTSNTISVARWCNKCRKQTQHRVDGHRAGPCMECGQADDPQPQAAAVLYEEACTCEKYAFPHFHEPEEQARSKARFRQRFAPLYGGDGKIISASSHRIDYFAGSKGEL